MILRSAQFHVAVAVGASTSSSPSTRHVFCRWHPQSRVLGLREVDSIGDVNLTSLNRIIDVNGHDTNYFAQ
jgi:hypothetical protein